MRPRAPPDPRPRKCLSSAGVLLEGGPCDSARSTRDSNGRDRGLLSSRHPRQQLRQRHRHAHPGRSETGRPRVGDAEGGERGLLRRHGSRDVPTSGSGVRRPAVPEDAGAGGRHLRQRPEQLDRVDGRQRHALELPVGPHVRGARLPEDAVDARHARLWPQQGRVRPLEIFRAGQRALFRSRDRPGPETVRPVARPPPFRAGLSARSVRGRQEISGRRHRRPRPEPEPAGRQEAARVAGHAAGRFLLRLRDRRGGAAAVSESRFRRGGGGEVGSGPLLQRPQLLREQGPGAAVSRRHVVRLLPRRAEPDQSAGRSREPEVGEPDLEPRGAVPSGSIASSSSTRSAHPATSRFSCSTPTCRGRSTPRWSRATTSTTPAR